MFDAVVGVEFGYVLCGIIWAIALGFAAGNYACSLVHRLPRGRLILDKKPYCGSCGASLQVKDLFPVVSALLLRHRCRYCGTPYPVSHTWTEVLVGLLFLLSFLEYSFSDQFLLIACIGIFLIVLAAIQANEGLVMRSVMLCIVVFGALFRTLQDHTIFNFFQGALLALVIGAVVWRKQIKPVAHVYVLPKQAKLLVIGGLCVGAALLPYFIVLFAGFYAIDWLARKLFKVIKPPLVTVSFGLAVMVPVLYPRLLHLI
jgi:leader peptidase (prepilin peptidase)/N-methyltransferase